MQEAAAGEIGPGGDGAGRRDEGRAAGKPPFRPDLGPVAGPRREASCRGAGKPQRAFGTCRRTRPVKQRSDGRQPVGQVWRDVGSVECHLIRRGIVQTGSEQRVGGNGDAVIREAGAHVGIVQQRAKQPCRDFAGVAAAGAAVIGAFLRVVGDLRAVAEQQDDGRMAGGEAHGAEHGGRGGDALRKRHAALDARRLRCALVMPAQSERIPDELQRVGGACRLDEGERRDGGLPEPAPGAARACRDACRSLCRRRRMAGRGERGAEQHRQMRLAQVGAMRTMRHGKAEEAGEAQGLHAGIETLERAAKHFRAHVDAEGGLQRGRVVARCGRCELPGQLALVGALQRVLKDGVGDIIG